MARARELLAASRGAGGFETTLLVLPSDGFEAVAEVVADGLARIGVRLTLAGADRAGEIRGGNAAPIMLRGFPDGRGMRVSDPNYAYVHDWGPGRMRLFPFRYENQEFFEALRFLVEAGHGPPWEEAARRLQRLHNADAVLIPLCNIRFYVAHVAELEGYRWYPDNPAPLRRDAVGGRLGAADPVPDPARDAALARGRAGRLGHRRLARGAEPHHPHRLRAADQPTHRRGRGRRAAARGLRCSPAPRRELAGFGRRAQLDGPPAGGRDQPPRPRAHGRGRAVELGARVRPAARRSLALAAYGRSRRGERRARRRRPHAALRSQAPEPGVPPVPLVLHQPGLRLDGGSTPRHRRRPVGDALALAPARGFRGVRPGAPAGRRPRAARARGVLGRPARDRLAPAGRRGDARGGAADGRARRREPSSSASTPRSSRGSRGGPSSRSTASAPTTRRCSSTSRLPPSTTGCCGRRSATRSPTGASSSASTTATRGRAGAR